MSLTHENGSLSFKEPTRFNAEQSPPLRFKQPYTLFRMENNIYEHNKHFVKRYKHNIRGIYESTFKLPRHDQMS